MPRNADFRSEVCLDRLSEQRKGIYPFAVLESEPQAISGNQLIPTYYSVSLWHYCFNSRKSMDVWLLYYYCCCSLWPGHGDTTVFLGRFQSRLQEGRCEARQVHEPKGSWVASWSLTSKLPPPQILLRFKISQCLSNRHSPEAFQDCHKGGQTRHPGRSAQLSSISSFRNTMLSAQWFIGGVVVMFACFVWSL